MSQGRSEVGKALTQEDEAELFVDTLLTSSYTTRIMIQFKWDGYEGTAQCIWDDVLQSNAAGDLVGILDSEPKR